MSDRRSSLAIAVVLTTLAFGSCQAQSTVEAFYKGRQINLIVGYGPGGGYDLTARLLARHIGRFIPGHPSVAVQNMPGAGSLRAANWLAEAAPTLAAARRKDGPPLVLGGTGEGARDGDVPKILRDALGLNIRQVLGYPDTPSIMLAVERGEVDGRMFDYSSVKTTKPQW